MSATSHDLLQPINAARLFTAALKPQLAAQADGDSVSLVEQIDASLQRAEKLIAELREIARVDSGRQLPRRTHFSAHQLLTSLEAEFRPQAAARGLRLRVVPSTTWLYSDQSLVYRMLQNLLSNAIKYTPRGRVLLGLRRRPLGAEIQVWDTGPGVAEPDRVRIFEEFERLQRAGIEEGLGLGLAIVQRYSDLLGHRLRLESRPDSGSMFSLQVTYGQRQAEPEAAREETANRDLESLLVACLDNDPLVLDGMARLLAGMGAQVITARDREQLLSQFAPGCSPDIVLADYHLDDGETGLEVLQAARHVTGADTPAIIISADDSDVIRDRSRAAGYRFLPKPVDAVRLRALVLAMTRDRATGPVRRRAN